MEALIFLCVIGAAISISLLFCTILVEKLHSEIAIAQELATDAIISAKALDKSTVIQRIVEKYHVVKPEETLSEGIKTAEKELENSIYGPKSPAEVKREIEEQMRNAVFGADDLV